MVKKIEIKIKIEISSKRSLSKQKYRYVNINASRSLEEMKCLNRWEMHLKSRSVGLCESNAIPNEETKTLKARRHVQTVQELILHLKR